MEKILYGVSIGGFLLSRINPQKKINEVLLTETKAEAEAIKKALETVLCEKMEVCEIKEGSVSSITPINDTDSNNFKKNFITDEDIDYKFSDARLDEFLGGEYEQ